MADSSRLDTLLTAKTSRVNVGPATCGIVRVRTEHTLTVVKQYEEIFSLGL